MPIFVVKNHEGKTIDVVLARERALALAYWHGKNVFPHKTDEYTEQALNGHTTGVIPLINIKKMWLSSFGRNEREYLVVE